MTWIQSWERPIQTYEIYNPKSELDKDQNSSQAVLKPQDSFGEFSKKNSWSAESAGNHQKTPSDLPAIVLKDIIVMQYCPVANYHYVHNLWAMAKCLGGTPKIFMFWLFPENGSISERTVTGH